MWLGLAIMLAMIFAIIGWVVYTMNKEKEVKE